MKRALTLTVAAALAFIAAQDVGGHGWSEPEVGRIATNRYLIPGYGLGDPIPIQEYWDQVYDNCLTPVEDGYALYRIVETGGSGKHGEKEETPGHEINENTDCYRWPLDADSSAWAYIYFATWQTNPMPCEIDVDAFYSIGATAGSDSKSLSVTFPGHWVMKSEYGWEIDDATGQRKQVMIFSPSRWLERKIVCANGYSYIDPDGMILPDGLSYSDFHRAEHSAYGHVLMFDVDDYGMRDLRASYYR